MLIIFTTTIDVQSLIALLAISDSGNVYIYTAVPPKLVLD